MNLNALIAVLELKGLISRTEGEKLVEYLANRPQSTVLADAVNQVKELLDSADQTLPTIADTAIAAAELVVDNNTDENTSNKKPAKK